MFFDNDELFDDLVGHILGLGVLGAAIYQPIVYHHLQTYCP